MNGNNRQKFREKFVSLSLEAGNFPSITQKYEHLIGDAEN